MNKYDQIIEYNNKNLDNLNNIPDIKMIGDKILENENIIKKNEEVYQNQNKEITNIVNSIKISKYFEAKKTNLTLDHQNIIFNEKKYIVCKIKRKNEDKLFLVDYEDREKIVFYNWIMTNSNYIIFNVNINDERKSLLLHNHIMEKYTFEGKGQEFVYDHINRMPNDNRKENLRLISCGENIINQPKKERKIELPTNCKIDLNDIPKCVWYHKSGVYKKKHHGDAFVVNIQYNFIKIEWKSSTSNGLSLRFKLEQTKKYLRLLKKENPEIFQKHNIEYEYNEEALKLAKEYNEIIKLSGYKCANVNLIKINEKNYLEEDLKDLTDEEKEILNNFTLKKNVTNRKLTTKLPKDCGITSDMIPKYCYFRPANKMNRSGDHFIIDRHPKLKTRDWKTSSSKKISLIEKFNMLLNKLKELENNSI